jgi:integrase
VFTTRAGTPQNRQNVRRRVLLPAIKAADAYLAKHERPPINPRLTPHSLRKTFASLLFERGETVPYVMDQLGHADPGVTLRVYAHVLNTRRRDGGLGTNSDLVPISGGIAANPA